MDRFERLSKIAQDEFGVTIKSKPSTGETFDSLYGETKDSDRREKQIEAIAKVICGGCPDNKECMHCLCADWYRAEALYNAGYRKQSEVAREIFAEIEDSMSCFEDDDDGYLLKKGEFKFFMRELKKEYTEESVND